MPEPRGRSPPGPGLPSPAPLCGPAQRPTARCHSHTERATHAGGGVAPCAHVTGLVMELTLYRSRKKSPGPSPGCPQASSLRKQDCGTAECPSPSPDRRKRAPLRQAKGHLGSGSRVLPVEPGDVGGWTDACPRFWAERAQGGERMLSENLCVRALRVLSPATRWLAWKCCGIYRGGRGARCQARGHQTVMSEVGCEPRSVTL